jgi:hypothetical protein
MEGKGRGLYWCIILAIDWKNWGKTRKFCQYSRSFGEIRTGLPPKPICSVECLKRYLSSLLRFHGTVLEHRTALPAHRYHNIRPTLPLPSLVLGKNAIYDGSHIVVRVAFRLAYLTLERMLCIWGGCGWPRISVTIQKLCWPQLFAQFWWQ